MPGVDETNIQRAFGAGLCHAKRESVAKAQLFRDGEGSHVADFGVAINFGTGASQHAGEIFDIFHGAHEVAKVGTIELITRHMDKILFRKFAGNGFCSVHESKRGGDDHVEALACQGAGNLLGIDTFCYVLNVGGVDAWNIILNIETTDIV